MPARPNKLLGQHFLRCPWVTDTLIQAAHIEKHDVVLEVGPGTGVLTRALAKRAKKVIAVEKDIVLAEKLKKDLAKEKVTNVEIIPGDILTILKSHFNMMEEMGVVGNIPYYLTSRLFRLLLENKSRPKQIVFTIQKEVAQRIAARSPHMNLLALSVQVFGTPYVIKDVPRSCFSPRPKIDSAILKIVPLEEDFFHKHGIDEDKFFTTIRAGFSQKRKLLVNTLSRFAPKHDIEKILIAASLSSLARPEELAPEDWVKIVSQLSID